MIRCATTTMIGFRVTPDEAAALKTLAGSAGVTLSAWIRNEIGLSPQPKAGRPRAATPTGPGGCEPGMHAPKEGA